MEQDKYIINEYIKFRGDPKNDGKTDCAFVSSIQSNLVALERVKSENPNWRHAVLEVRRQTYTDRMTELDEGLFKAAANGNTAAADLLYRRFDGWNPKEGADNTVVINFYELIKAAKNGTPNPRRN